MALPGQGRIGFATPKAAGSIARRNRIKRRFREALRLMGGAVDTRFDCVISILPSADRAKFEAIRKDLAGVFAKMAERWENESECS